MPSRLKHGAGRYKVFAQARMRAPLELTRGTWSWLSVESGNAAIRKRALNPILLLAEESKWA